MPKLIYITRKLTYLLTAILKLITSIAFPKYCECEIDYEFVNCCFTFTLPTRSFSEFILRLISFSKYISSAVSAHSAESWEHEYDQGLPEPRRWWENKNWQFFWTAQTNSWGWSSIWCTTKRKQNRVEDFTGKFSTGAGKHMHTWFFRNTFFLIFSHSSFHNKVRLPWRKWSCCLQTSEEYNGHAVGTCLLCKLCVCHSDGEGRNPGRDEERQVGQ